MPETQYKHPQNNSQPEKHSQLFLNIPSEVAGNKDLTFSARLIYGALNMLWHVNKKSFRVSKTRLAELSGCSRATVSRGLHLLRSRSLIVTVATGRASYYQLLPFEEPSPEPEQEDDVDKSGVEDEPKTHNEPSEGSTSTSPHKRVLLDINNDYDTPNVDNGEKSKKEDELSPEMKKDLEERFKKIGFGWSRDGKKQLLTVDTVVNTYGLSWVLSWLEKTEDIVDDLKNPGGWMLQHLKKVKPSTQ